MRYCGANDDGDATVMAILALEKWMRLDFRARFRHISSPLSLFHSPIDETRSPFPPRHPARRHWRLPPPPPILGYGSGIFIACMEACIPTSQCVYLFYPPLCLIPSKSFQCLYILAASS